MLQIKPSESSTFAYDDDIIFHYFVLFKHITRLTSGDSMFFGTSAFTCYTACYIDFQLLLSGCYSNVKTNILLLAAKQRI